MGERSLLSPDIRLPHMCSLNAFSEQYLMILTYTKRNTVHSAYFPPLGSTVMVIDLCDTMFPEHRKRRVVCIRKAEMLGTTNRAGAREQGVIHEVSGDHDG